ncbi:MAG TPA: glycine zipper 2TM domain-containing protein [Allosphingosinicella sp.]|nr:glycine zipper 2TM domain-containing protein [Allosphingosinicella sp.]
MFRKLTLATAAATTLAMVPATAQASHRDGYRDYGGYEQSYRGDRYGRYDSRYYGNRSYRYGRRCSGTTGTIVGGVAGALLGREVTRDRYRGRSGTTGAILGGAIGALAGRSIDKSSCRR